jgi:hypothetical protein
MEDDSFTVQAQVDLTPHVPASAAIVEVTPKQADTTTTKVHDTSPADETASQSGHGRDHGAPTPGSGGAAALAAQAEELRLQILATTGGDSALRAALSKDVIPVAELDAAAAANSRVTTTGNDLKLAPGGQLVTPGPTNDLSRIAQTHDDTSTRVTHEREVVPTFQIDVPPPPRTGPIPNPEGPIAKLRPGFRKCYVAGLTNENPDMAGSVTIRTKVRPTGEVDSADPMNLNGLSSTVAQCLAKRVLTAQFEAPGGTGATIDIPIKFVPLH